MTAELTRRAEELGAAGTVFVTATVVRAQRPTSVEAGDVALVHADGTIDGFVGGECTQHSVRLHALEALERGEALLLRVLAEGSEEPDEAGVEVASEEGAVTVRNPCLSGGAIEIFLEPVLPAPRVLVLGETPVADALRRLCPELGLDAVALAGGVPEPAGGDLALIVAAHGRDELAALRRGLESGLPYVGLVASRKRGSALVGELRAAGVADATLDALDMPAGMPIGARTSGEIALAILARVVAVRRGGAVPAPVSAATRPAVAVDPICGMTVVATAGTRSVEFDGETVYFCGEGCQAAFQAQHEHAIAPR